MRRRRRRTRAKIRHRRGTTKWSSVLATDVSVFQDFVEVVTIASSAACPPALDGGYGLRGFVWRWLPNMVFRIESVLTQNL
eukprot:gene19958-biopygen14597